uniref:Alternative protein ANKRD11 n=1 Tax=Homo sapiens TaxID=9606 RepID=L0R6C4_HUMAN|nr:alternative protein ANKRD11 [Homo sapiens]
MTTRTSCSTAPTRSTPRPCPPLPPAPAPPPFSTGSPWLQVGFRKTPARLLPGLSPQTFTARSLSTLGGPPRKNSASETSSSGSRAFLLPPATTLPCHPRWKTGRPCPRFPRRSLPACRQGTTPQTMASRRPKSTLCTAHRLPLSLSPRLQRASSQVYKQNLPLPPEPSCWFLPSKGPFPRTWTPPRTSRRRPPSSPRSPATWSRWTRVPSAPSSPRSPLSGPTPPSRRLPLA